MVRGSLATEPYQKRPQGQNLVRKSLHCCWGTTLSWHGSVFGLPDSGALTPAWSWFLVLTNFSRTKCHWFEKWPKNLNSLFCCFLSLANLVCLHFVEHGSSAPTDVYFEMISSLDFFFELGIFESISSRGSFLPVLSQREWANKLSTKYGRICPLPDLIIKAFLR